MKQKPEKSLRKTNSTRNIASRLCYKYKFNVVLFFDEALMKFSKKILGICYILKKWIIANFLSRFEADIFLIQIFRSHYVIRFIQDSNDADIQMLSQQDNERPHAMAEIKFLEESK